MKLGSGNILLKNNKGTSMVTVLVSFALLLIFVTAFYKVQHVSSEMMMGARDMLIDSRNLTKAYYLGETRDTLLADDVRLSFRGKDGSFFVDATLYKAEKPGNAGVIYYYDSDKEQGDGETAR
ncbi:MAG: hypothetical protein IKY23_04220 [Lachnospiraceae bacterium]|nr:hypothetical protein [Lachnospiraceae bacterium]